MSTVFCRMSIFVKNKNKVFTNYYTDCVYYYTSLVQLVKNFAIVTILNVIIEPYCRTFHYKLVVVI